jgi:hypothetical protein
MTPSDTAHPEGEREAVAIYLREWMLNRFGKRIFKTTADELADAILALLSGSRPQGEEGLAQEPKYRFDGGRVINRASGEAIPQDEPVFVFRARDRKALEALNAYFAEIDDADHITAVHERIADFTRFATQHPERMKEPDTATSSQGKPSS